MRLTQEEYVEKFLNACPSGFTVAGEYLGGKKKVSIRCEKCHTVFTIVAGRVVHDTFKCPECGSKKPSQFGEIKKHSDIFAATGGEYVALGVRDTKKGTELVEHRECGHQYYVGISHFRNGRRCPNCDSTAVHSHADFVRKSRKLPHIAEYEIMSEYMGAKSKVLLLHKICGTEYWVGASNFLCGTQCPNCYGKNVKTHNQFLAEINDLPGARDYHFLEEYVSAKKKILVQHIVCGKKYRVAPDRFLSGRRCPACSRSLGEATISDYFDKIGIEYTHNKSIKNGPKYKKPLRFDFILEKGFPRMFVIEFDGIQHERPAEGICGMYDPKKAKRQFEYIKKLDEIKNDYCLKNGIPLYRIPYSQLDNVRDVIDDIIAKERSTTIPKGSTLQAYGNGNGRGVTDAVI